MSPSIQVYLICSYIMLFLSFFKFSSELRLLGSAYILATVNYILRTDYFRTVLLETVGKHGTTWRKHFSKKSTRSKQGNVIVRVLELKKYVKNAQTTSECWLLFSLTITKRTNSQISFLSKVMRGFLLIYNHKKKLFRNLKKMWLFSVKNSKSWFVCY